MTTQVQGRLPLPGSSSWLLGALVALGMGAGAWYVGHIGASIDIELVRSMIENLAEPPVSAGFCVFGVAVVFFCLTMLLQDWLRLRQWAQALRHFDAAKDSGKSSWIYEAFLQCKAQLDERPTVGDLQGRVRTGRQHYGSRLARRWLIHYVIGFGLPLVGLACGLFILEKKPEIWEYRKIFLPLTLATTACIVVVGLTVWLSKNGNDALSEWQWLAEQLAKAELGNQPVVTGKLLGFDSPPSPKDKPTEEAPHVEDDSPFAGMPPGKLPPKPKLPPPPSGPSIEGLFGSGASPKSSAPKKASSPPARAGGFNADEFLNDD